MRILGQQNLRIPTLLLLFFLMLAASGCSTVGPRSISAGRADYNKAINKTENEQMLLSIVKGRYGETSTLLAVSSVAANVRFSTNASVEAGFGPDESFAGNLIPFSGGVAYEENPTVTYTPVHGEQYFRQLMSPIPLSILLLGIRNVDDSDNLFTLLVNRVNDLRNPDFLYEEFAAADPRFIRFVELFTELRKAGVLEFVKDPEAGAEFDVLISNFTPNYKKEVLRLIALLDLPKPEGDPDQLVIPAYLAINNRKAWGIGITTRSTQDLIEILRAAVEIPEEHAAEGLAIDFPPRGLPGQGARIISSKEKPKRMMVGVQHEGYWYYIDKTDQGTKSVFRLLRTFWSISIAYSAEQKAVPVLTIPVSR